ncbi:hypothetical protein BD414DRAFT_453550 [Trametes punicea]|nr:hypothetical protein BD414DRAFT_453550 [Trametes punicea]
MFPWSLSWLPSLPSIDLSLPTGIQKRFISFALRQALGHLLKPGQLDVQQVDSQIGSGYVQVRDLELNDEAINALISGLPMQLRDGSVGKVTARIPWPNPLTSTVGLSLESLQLTFYLEPTPSDKRPLTENLAESVASVAETFIHEELSEGEEASLRESFHPELRGTRLHTSDDSLPGGLDPFMSEEEVHRPDADPPGVSIFATLIERLLARFQFDAVDTRITIVNPQKASFTLIVPEIRYSTDPQGTPSATSSGRSGPPEAGEVRKIIVTGVTVTSRCLRPLSPHPLVDPGSRSPSQAPMTTAFPQATSSPAPLLAESRPLDSDMQSERQDRAIFSKDSPSPVRPSSPCSDSSDIDEETQMFMSQSIASLPPRPTSPASSVASSMYQSALSTSVAETVLGDVAEETTELRNQTPSPSSPAEPLGAVAGSSSADGTHSATASPVSPRSPAVSPFERRVGIQTGDIEDETVLSFGPDPIEIRLTTPPSRASRAPSSASMNQQEPPKTEAPAQHKAAAHKHRIQVDITMGTIACALSARQVGDMIDIAKTWSSHSPPARPPSSSNPAVVPKSSFPMDDVEGSLGSRGLVVLLLPVPRTSASNPDDALTEYFARPLLPPCLPIGYTRIHIDGISSSLSIRRSELSKGKQSVRRSETPSTSVSLIVSEISAFAFSPHSSITCDMSASPIIITDPQLPSQYPDAHLQPLLDATPDYSSSLPTFEAIDWTDPRQRGLSAKLSLWRTKPPTSDRSFPQATQSDLPGVSLPLRGLEATEPSSETPARPTPVVLPPSPRRLGLTALAPSSMKHSQQASKTSPPALSLKFHSASHQLRKGREPSHTADMQISVAPIHVFLDIGAILGPAMDGKSEVLRFLEDLSKSDVVERTEEGLVPSDTESEEISEEDSRPGTPRLSGLPDSREREAERERQRLEQLVLEDLELAYDYRTPNVPQQMVPAPDARKLKRREQPKTPEVNMTINVPAIRVEVRVPPPTTRLPRSGALIIDVHDLCLSPGRAPESESSSTRFTAADNLYGGEPWGGAAQQEGNVVLGVTWKRIVLAHSLMGDSKARAILSLGTSQRSYFGVGTPPARAATSNRSGLPHLVITHNPIAPSTLATVSSTAVSLDIPAIHVELSKPLIDGLQLWADDFTQCLEAAFAGVETSDGGTEKAGSVESSLIGSRYFARTNTLASATDSGATSLAGTIKHRQGQRSETAVKVAVNEVAVRLLVPREEEQDAARPFDITASDVDILLESKPEGKDETVVTLGVMAMNVYDTTAAGRNCFLSLTAPKSSDAAIRSALKLRFTSLVVPETTVKESRVRLTLCGITYHFYPDLHWATNLGRFFKAPPGTFESVVPSERTRVNIRLVDTSIRLLASSHPGALVPYIGELDFTTVIEGNSSTTSMNVSVPSLALLLIDDASTPPEHPDASDRIQATADGIAFWKSSGYALLAEIRDLILSLRKTDSVSPPDTRLVVDQGDLRLHMCADTMGALTAFIGDFSSAFKPSSPDSTSDLKQRNEPADVTRTPATARGLLSSLDDQAFRRLPEVGAAADMIEDDLPTNADYLDESFGAAAGLRELSDDEFDESDVEHSYTPAGAEDTRGVTSSYGGETIRMLRPEGIQIVENYFDTLPPDRSDYNSYGDTTFRMRIHDLNATVFLYDGYDWVRTRKIIEEKAKEMRRKLAKIRQLVASGQTPDPSVEETNTLLFNSVYIGLEHNVDELEPGALIAAIDEELNEEFETTTQSSWQSLKPQPLSSPGRSGSHSMKPHRRRLRRGKGPSIEFRLIGLDAEVDHYRPDASLVSRVLATVRDVEILDHIKTSTWKKFLTSLQTDSRGNVRETDSNMVRVELRMLHPVPGHPSEEARLRAKILPLRLHVDQDALDFLKQFFSFKDPDAAPTAPSEPSSEIYFQQAEVFPIDIKLDYKPRRVDYRALREGRTIELMNFFHFDGAEMTLRHITLNGITGWPRFFDLLNDLWTPDVKATQLVDVISGVAPIRSVVNVGSGVADLVLLPIAQYKKDGRIVRGLQKGANAFVKSTAMEAIKLGARLATGTQVILEQAETVLGGQFKDQVMAEAMQVPMTMEVGEEGSEDDDRELISKYADQPTNVKEGVKSAYQSLKRNLNSAAQTILAVPMEVYERSGNEGPVRAVVRAVPIAVLKPMIGASEAVSKTLLGLQNTLDPNIRQENEDKYKRR